MTTSDRERTVWSYCEFMAQEEHDQEPLSVWPDIRYAIVGSPRTGSNLLCSYLYQLGLGVPMEYLSRWTTEHLPERLGAWTPTNYVETLFSRRTSVIPPDTSVFGVKTLWPYEWQRAQSFLWPTHVIRLFREDQDQQAESYAIARKSGIYTVIEEPGPPPEVPSPEEITQAGQVLTQLDQFWNQNVDAQAAFSYEFLVDEPVAALEHIVEEVFDLEIEVPPDIQPITKKQGTT